MAAILDLFEDPLPDVQGRPMYAFLTAARSSTLSRGDWFKYSAVLFCGGVPAVLAHAIHLMINAGNPNYEHFFGYLGMAWAAVVHVGFLVVNSFRLHDIGLSGLHQVWFIALTISVGRLAGPYEVISLLIVAFLFLALVPGSSNRKDALSPVV